MAGRTPSTDWLAAVRRDEGPIYQAVLGALEAAIRSGALHPGDQLPPHRQVAERLGVDLTTVTRAYGEARRRGWIEGAVGRGTFVSARALDDDPGLVDLSMNLPPPPLGLSLGALLRETTTAILQGGDAGRLMAYHPGAGTPGQHAAGAAWLAPYVGPVAVERVLVTPGAQTALAAILSLICPPSAALVVEPLTYPGLKQVAERLGVRLVPCPADEDGLIPEALERLCVEQRPAGVYLVPTMQNPTASVMSPARRAELGRIAEKRGLWIVEDDPYSRLMADPAPAIASLAPARTFHVATLAKCLSPGLRVAFVVCPTPALASEVAAAVRAFALTPPPLMAAVATRWIRDGGAETLLGAIRAEALARRTLAAEALPQARAAAAESIHLWLPLTAGGEALRRAAEARGLALVTAQAFAVGDDAPAGVRLSLGGPASREVLAKALADLRAILETQPARGGLVV